ncbi:hypothetical protein O181_010323 [Austropuccinia psidii MF-1]|uniref:Reverse transcriptase domain-containing protein n=1 Tax=Austropuccinia psidii MF-1 TaxID=1389203 RepID=A0A9Q3BT40_9BASI|nr:hypothetical protein [Austropuccinia psidii MF-1]
MPKANPLLRIISHCGIYDYLRMPFGIKNAPSHYQKILNTIFSMELSEGWPIIYIYDIIICSDSWSLRLERLARVLDKFAGVNMKISLKKGNFGFEELKALELSFKTSVHSSTAQTPAMLEKGWDTILQEDKVKKDLIDIHPTASSFSLMLDKVKQNSKQSINVAFDY